MRMLLIVKLYEFAELFGTVGKAGAPDSLQKLPFILPFKSFG